MNEFENKSMEEVTSAEENPSEIAEETEISEEKPKASPIHTLYDYLETFCYALAVMVVLLLFVFRMVSVDGRSMEQTLYHEDKLIISDLFYTPKTGDIVVINPEINSGSGEPIIKRVIATEGQKVYIDYENWAVYVDGVRLDEPYIEPMRQVMQETFGDDVSMSISNVAQYNEEFTVGENMVFVMGDNRNMSRDSRDSMYGEMNENRILGRVIIRLTPNFGFVD